jgi:hypothetical protein
MPPFCRISSVPSTFLESITTKAGTLKDDELPCVNPTRNSFLWFLSIVSYLFHDKCWLSQNTFLQQERKSCILVVGKEMPISRIVIAVPNATVVLLD